MKKIKSMHSNKDLIICVSIRGQHEFFYQAVGSSEKYSFHTMKFSTSVFNYFRKYGHRISGHSFSLTVGELYHFNAHYNYKLSHLMELLPKKVDHVLREIPFKELSCSSLYYSNIQENLRASTTNHLSAA